MLTLPFVAETEIIEDETSSVKIPSMLPPVTRHAPYSHAPGCPDNDVIRYVDGYSAVKE